MVTREEVLHVAKLAKLELAPKDVDRFVNQLGTILDYVDQLRELDQESAEEMTHVAVVDAPLRPDVPSPSLPRAEVLALAPQTDGETMLVPPVLEGGGSA